MEMKKEQGCGQHRERSRFLRQSDQVNHRLSAGPSLGSQDDALLCCFRYQTVSPWSLSIWSVLCSSRHLPQVRFPGFSGCPASFCSKPEGIVLLTGICQAESRSCSGIREKYQHPLQFLLSFSCRFSVYNAKILLYTVKKEKSKFLPEQQRKDGNQKGEEGFSPTETDFRFSAAPKAEREEKQTDSGPWRSRSGE